MEIFRELDRLDKEIRRRSAPLDEWRRFVYCTNLIGLPPRGKRQSHLSGSLLGEVEHFPHGPNRYHSPTWVCHLPQHDLLRLLRNQALKQDFCDLLEGSRASVEEFEDRVSAKITNLKTGHQFELNPKFVICAEGAHSATREQLSIHLESQTGTLQHLIDVHFFSEDLPQLLYDRVPAMLYFVYSTSGIGVFVAHSLQHGEFVLQIPYFPPHERVQDFSNAFCLSLIRRLVGTTIDIDIRDVQPWRMGVWSASRYRSRWGRCFLVGDTAHQFPPAGGFGMNTGIQDAHNLIWKIVLALQYEKDGLLDSVPALLESYEAERRPVAEYNASVSVRNFFKTTKIPATIGLNFKVANLLKQGLDWLPTPSIIKRFLFSFAMRLSLLQVKILKSENALSRHRHRALAEIFSRPGQTLQLLFPRQDLGFVYTKRWKSGKVRTDFYESNSLEFNPGLILGGRVPHFWIQGKSGKKISSLDLPALLVDSYGGPQHVLLHSGSTSKDSYKRVHGVHNKFRPLIDVRVSDTQGDQVDYVYIGGRPRFLPATFALILRPDGHIAWISSAPSC